jgi:hypothetical protein
MSRRLCHWLLAGALLAICFGLGQTLWWFWVAL